MRGGYRPGAGRKKGYSAIESEKAREFIAQKVSASLEPIISSLIRRARSGNISATRELLDRAYGRVPQVRSTTEDLAQEPLMVVVISGRELPTVPYRNAIYIPEAVATKNGIAPTVAG